MGGYAIRGISVLPIPKENISHMINTVATLAHIPVDALIPVGSTGKKSVSNDIDLVLDSSIVDSEEINGRLSKVLPTITFNKGTGIGSYPVPFVYSPDQEMSAPFGQVDLIFTPNVSWAKFAYDSPEQTQSIFKGAVRTMLLMGVASIISEPGYDDAYHVNSQLVGRVGRTFDLNKGLRRIFQFRPKRKDGKGYLKTLKTVSTIEEVEEGTGIMFDSVVYRTDTNMSFVNPEAALAVMFKRPIQPEDVSSAEQVLTLISHSFTEEERNQIYKNTAKRAMSVKDKIKIPEEISKYF